MKNFLVIIVVLATGFAVFVNFRPSEFKVSRSTQIMAPSAVVVEQVNNFHLWEKWSPWAKLDPNAKTSYEGPTFGVGAKFNWSGNNNVGEGSQTIVESRPDLIRIQLDFIKPFKGTSMSEFAFQEHGNSTEVRWSISGQNNFIAKAMGLFMDCDKFMGGQFEQGLASLKAVVEKK